MGVGVLLKFLVLEKLVGKLNVGYGEDEVVIGNFFGFVGLGVGIFLGFAGGRGLVSVVGGYMLVGKVFIRFLKFRFLGFGSFGGNGYCLLVAASEIFGFWLLVLRGSRRVLAGFLAFSVFVRRVKRRRRRRKLSCSNMSW